MTSNIFAAMPIPINKYLTLLSANSSPFCRLLLKGRKNRCQFVAWLCRLPTHLSKNPDFSQSSELPLFTIGLRFYPKILNIFSDSKFNTNYLPAFFCSVSAFQLCLEPKDIKISSNLIILLLDFLL